MSNIQKAVEYLQQEKLVEGYSDEDWAAGYRLQFSAGGVLYATEEESLAHKDTWRYMIPLEADGTRYLVYVAYETMELIDIQETKGRKSGEE